MSNVLHRTTKEFLRSVNEPDYPVQDWIHDPDMSAVAGFDGKYWVINGDSVSLMSQAERDAVDAAEAAAAIVQDKADQKGRIDAERAIKALALLTLDMHNLYKSRIKAAALDSPLPEITPAQMKQMFLDKVDSI